MSNKTSIICGILLTIISAYLLGSLNFGVMISRFKPQGDIRNHGSGNAGMTNMLRVYGKGAAFGTALGDFLKGVISVLLARYAIGVCFLVNQWVDAGYIAGLFVLLGHIFPVYFHFRGGKGVMTSLGVMFILDPFVFIGLLVVTLPIVFKTRIVSLGSILGAVLLPWFTLVSRLVQGKSVVAEFIVTLAISGIVLFMHRENIIRLKNGTENQFSPKQ